MIEAADAMGVLPDNLRFTGTPDDPRFTFDGVPVLKSPEEERFVNPECFEREEGNLEAFRSTHDYARACVAAYELDRQSD